MKKVVIQMKSEQQFQQLMMQYKQLKNGAEDIKKMIEREDFDSAITLLKTREQIFISCKAIKRYLELTPEQQIEADKIFNEIKEIELSNMDMLKKGMEDIRTELTRTQKAQKLHKAYGRNNEDAQGTIINFEK